MLLKVMVEPLCLRPGASVDPSHLYAEASPFVPVCGTLIFFFLIYLTYYFFGGMVFRILVPQPGIDCASCSPQLEKNPPHAAMKTHCRDFPAGLVSIRLHCQCWGFDAWPEN